MATTDASGVFIDTNVLVYAATPDALQHQTAILTLQTLEREGTPLWVSRQIFREYLAVLSRPQAFTPPIEAEVMASHVRTFESQFHIAEDDAVVTARLLDLMEQVAIGGKQVHDANIVATMLTSEISHLLTFNARDFTRFVSLITVMALEVDAASS